MKVVVVGAGFGGLAAAIRLQAQGHDVQILEQRGQAGGRAAVFERDGFVFDAGPTILTAPQLIAELFELSGRRLDQYVTLVPLDPFYRVRFDDGSSVLWPQSESARLEEIGRLSPADVGGYQRFTRQAARIFEAALPLIDRPFETADAMLRVLPQLIQGQGVALGGVAGRRSRARPAHATAAELPSPVDWRQSL